MTNYERNQDAVIEYLESLNIENLYITDCISTDDIDEYTDFDSLTNLIDENSGFDVDIIYYSNAIEYLSNNDASLHESLSIAAEYGYSVDSLSSEILASLLASRNCRDEWHGYENDITNFLYSLDWDEEETDGE